MRENPAYIASRYLVVLYLLEIISHFHNEQTFNATIDAMVRTDEL